MSHENEINEARALCFDEQTDCLWVVSLIETKMKKSIVVTFVLYSLINFYLFIFIAIIVLLFNLI